MSSATPPELPGPAQSRAVLIGTSRYHHLPNLPQVERGIQELRDLLCDERLWGLPHENCTVLLNAKSPRETQKAIESAAEAAGSDGALLVYFCGHGLVDVNDDLHLGLSNTESLAPDSTAMVVFIDDLDRCTPRTTAEVFEAINVFVTRHFPVTRFVLCLDTTTVATRLDDVYASLKSKPLHGDDPSPGWSFLRKLIQLPVAIPPIDPAAVPRLPNSLLGEIRQPVRRTRVPAPEPFAAAQYSAPPPRTPALTADVVTAVAEVLEHDQGVRDLMTERLKEQESLSVREAKRMLTIWQYYVRVLVRLGSPGLAESARHLVIFAEIIARWPAAQRALNRRRDGVHGLELLAKAQDDWEWAKALRTLDLHGAPHHKCASGIRDLLQRYDGTRVAALASLLA